MDFKSLRKSLQPLEAADKTAELLSNYLAILTSSNIESIVYDARQLKIDTAESLKQCIDVIFESAVSETPSLVSILCTKLMFDSVPVCKDSQKMITFKEQIYEKSQWELHDFLDRQALINIGQCDKEIKSCDDEADEEIVKDSCLKKLRRPVALLRFIGELYLVDLLPASFMQHCVSQLLDECYCNESTLEMLYALLKLIGKTLEFSDDNSTFDLSVSFKLLEERKSSINMSPHTRFMLDELIEIRKNNWEPVTDIDWIMLYNLFLCDVEEKLYVLELWYGK